MTIDDESSVYVGGLPYDATEDSVRQVFDLYGAVVAVKIINDSTSRAGKCYGFVTFRNPRSAIVAINDMDGRTVDGRVVRVNPVRSRVGGRLGFGRGEGFRGGRSNVERGRSSWGDRGGGREHEMEYYDNERERERERYRVDRYSYSGRSMERDRSREGRSIEFDQERDGGYERRRIDHDHEVLSERFSDRDRARDDGDNEDDEQGRSRNRDRGWGRGNRSVESDRDKEMDRTNHRNDIIGKDRDQQSMRGNGSSSLDRKSRELLSHSSDDFNDQLKELLEKSTQRLEELKNETSQMKERLGDEGNLVLDLQEKSKKLEDALINAKKFTSHQKAQLNKLHDCYKQVQNHREKLQNSEHELQKLVETLSGEDCIDDVDLRDKIVAIGNA